MGKRSLEALRRNEALVTNFWELRRRADIYYVNWAAFLAKGAGFKHVLFSPRFLGKWSNLMSLFFQMGWFNHQVFKEKFGDFFLERMGQLGEWRKMKWIHPPNSHFRTWKYGAPWFIRRWTEVGNSINFWWTMSSPWGGDVISIYCTSVGCHPLHKVILVSGGCSNFEGMRCLFLSKMGGKARQESSRNHWVVGTWYCWWKKSCTTWDV